MAQKLSDLSPELQAEARHYLSDPKFVPDYLAFIERHDIERVVLFTDDFGTPWLRDLDGNVSPAEQRLDP